MSTQSTTVKRKVARIVYDRPPLKKLSFLLFSLAGLAAGLLLALLLHWLGFGLGAAPAASDAPVMASATPAPAPTAAPVEPTAAPAEPTAAAEPTAVPAEPTAAPAEASAAPATAAAVVAATETTTTTTTTVSTTNLTTRTESPSKVLAFLWQDECWEWYFALALVGLLAGMMIGWGWGREVTARIEEVEQAPMQRRRSSSTALVRVDHGRRW